MNKTKGAHWLLVWTAITILLTLLGLVILERQALLQTSQPLFNEMLEFHGSLKVGQSFVASRPGLCRVDLLLARKGRTNRFPVIFHLGEGAEATADLATVTINASHLEDVTTMVRRPYVYQSFSFSPIPDSAGKTLYFWVESPQSSADDPLLVRYQTGDVYPEGAMSIGGSATGPAAQAGGCRGCPLNILSTLSPHDELLLPPCLQEGKNEVEGIPLKLPGLRCASPIDGDLAFKAYYAKGFLGNTALLLERLVEHKPLPWGSKAFYVALFITYLALFAGLVQLLLKLCAHSTPASKTGSLPLGFCCPIPL